MIDERKYKVVNKIDDKIKEIENEINNQKIHMKDIREVNKQIISDIQKINTTTKIYFWIFVSVSICIWGQTLLGQFVN